MLNKLDNNTFRPKTRSKACERGHTGEQSPGSVIMVVIICSLQEEPVSLLDMSCEYVGKLERNLQLKSSFSIAVFLLNSEADVVAAAAAGH